ncbi:MAG: zf-HC2 domain-containing protein [Chitinophagaceae bacterium]|nr:zf-HC2 domain-containing protein [Chitinophagaceae bacterium]
MNKLEKIAYNCRKATLLIEKQQFGRLTMGERVELKMHLAGCSVCRIFQQQSVTINKMIKDLYNQKSVRSTLDGQFKHLLQERINRKLSM